MPPNVLYLVWKYPLILSLDWQNNIVGSKKLTPPRFSTSTCLNSEREVEFCIQFTVSWLLIHNMSVSWVASSKREMKRKSLPLVSHSISVIIDDVVDETDISSVSRDELDCSTSLLLPCLASWLLTSLKCRFGVSPEQVSVVWADSSMAWLVAADSDPDGTVPRAAAVGINWGPWIFCNRSKRSWSCLWVFNSSWCRDSKDSRFGEAGGTWVAPPSLKTTVPKILSKNQVLFLRMTSSIRSRKTTSLKGKARHTKKNIK